MRARGVLQSSPYLHCLLKTPLQRLIDDEDRRCSVFIYECHALCNVRYDIEAGYCAVQRRRDGFPMDIGIIAK